MRLLNTVQIGRGLEFSHIAKLARTKRVWKPAIGQTCSPQRIRLVAEKSALHGLRADFGFHRLPA
jgi:hypothetical protein